MTPSEWSLEAQAGPTRVLLPDAGSLPALPAPPDDFEVLSELGEGTQGRVFLARQRSLGDRPMVLKVTACRGQEHVTLARLQHTHIVPLYWAQDEEHLNRRTLCMPYLGTLSLAGLLNSLHAKATPFRTGRDILDALDRAAAAAPMPPPSQDPARDFLQQTTYTRAVCWIGVCLAKALHFAHQRGLVHLDLKPSNVLIAGDGQPMLLDFHLTRGPIPQGASRPQGLGGTPAYMAPEHRAAMDAVVSGNPVPFAVDGRADLYALGLMLYQALGGLIQVPLPYPRLDHLNLEVSPGLADILQRCLDPDAEKRYATGDELAEDLRRHIDNEPLLGVANRSWRERWTKWRRRRPHALTNYSLVALLMIVLALSGVLVLSNHQAQLHDRIERIEEAWNLAQTDMRGQRFDSAIASLEQALSVAETTSGAGDWPDTIRNELKVAKRGRILSRLHHLAEKARFAAGALYPSPDADDLDASFQDLWKKRKELLELANSDHVFGKGPVHADLRDLVLTWLDLQRRNLSAENAQFHHRDALARLEEAETIFGTGPVFLREKMVHAAALGDTTRADHARRLLLSHPPKTAWHHYSLGRSYLRADNLERAAVHFDQAVDLEPENFWANFYQGVCASRQGRHADAVNAYRAALVARPDEATVYFNRALAYAALKEGAKAMRDYTRAIRLDPLLARTPQGKSLANLQR